MGFDDLIKKGKDLVGDKDGNIDYKQYSEDAKSAYNTFTSKDGSYSEKAQSAYSDFQKNHASKDSSSSSDKKEEKK